MFQPISIIRDRLKASTGSAQTTPTNNHTAIAPQGYPAFPNDRNATVNLAYPLNVEGDLHQGHYITFYVRVLDPAKLRAFKKAKANIAEVEKKLAAAASGARAFTGAGVVDVANHISDQQLDQYKSDKALVEGNKQTESGIKQNSIVMKSRPTVRLKGAISLYMPPSVQVSYESKYGEQEIGFLAEGGYNIIKQFQSGGANAKDVAMSGLNTLELGAKKAILKTLDVAAPGAGALFALDEGRVITPKMELMFEGIGRRNFSFTFTFIPKSAQEAKVVKNIILMFKTHMSADYAGQGASGTGSMSFPDQFDIEYMHMGKLNPNLNKIATCALTKMDVQYGGDRYVAYEDGVPQTTNLTLNFTEFEIITRELIEAGY